MLLVLLLIAGSIYFVGTRHCMFNKKPVSSPRITLPAAPKDTVAMPHSVQSLIDSTRIFLIGDTRFILAKKYPIRREIQIDGDCFFEVPDVSRPLIIKTKLLELSVPAKAAFMIIAPAKEEWSEIQVLSGVIIVKKAYPSTYNEPDTLHAEQMFMLNRNIDLGEKEKFNIESLKEWYKRITITTVRQTTP